MPTSPLILAMGLALQIGTPGPSETPNYPALSNAYGSYGFEGSSENRYPFDSNQNWVHGYFQEIPAYGGHHVFRPYNYKDVLSQSQTAAGWGERPSMPYSQQFWHKYHDQATMLKTSRQIPGWGSPVSGRYTPIQNSPAMPLNAMPASGHVIPGQLGLQTLPFHSQQGTSFVPTGVVEQMQGPVLQHPSEINATSFRK